MKKTKVVVAFGCIEIVISLLSLAASTYVNFRILDLIKADNLMWFLFWGNLPLLLILKTMAEVAKSFLSEN
ncbi:hypothetical protein hrd7_25170 [Leptolinea sp. HRD-7]|nr:hypothetical protein hrd7_25170 [Leptolinea sp. HRD-7]